MPCSHCVAYACTHQLRAHYYVYTDVAAQLRACAYVRSVNTALDYYTKLNRLLTHKRTKTKANEPQTSQSQYNYTGKEIPLTDNI